MKDELIMKILIVAGLADFLPSEKFDVVVGVDRGALWLLENGLTLDIAVGDFDSVQSEELLVIVESGAEVHKLKAEKDETDLEVALRLATTHYPEAEITVIGALGGRLDHELTNIFLPISQKFVKFAGQITLANPQNLLKYLTAGRHELMRIPDKKYIGFIKVAAENFSIENAKYPLKAAENFAEIYASNEFVGDRMTVEFDKGCVIVVYSSD